MVPSTPVLVLIVQGFSVKNVTVPGVETMASPENASMKFEVVSFPEQISSTAQLGSKPEQIIFCPGAISPLQDKSAALEVLVARKAALVMIAILANRRGMSHLSFKSCYPPNGKH